MSGERLGHALIGSMNEVDTMSHPISGSNFICTNWHCINLHTRYGSPAQVDRRGGIKEILRVNIVEGTLVQGWKIISDYNICELLDCKRKNWESSGELVLYLSPLNLIQYPKQ